MNKKSTNLGLVLVISYFLIFLVNSLVIYLANLFFPRFVVLGTASITRLWAIIHSMSTLSLINVFAIPFVREYENKKGKMLDSKQWIIAYFLINFVGLWLIARFADNLGLGISSFVVALVLAIPLDVLQGVVMMKLEKLKGK